MNYQEKFKENKKKQLDVFKKNQTHITKRSYRNALEGLIDKTYGFKNSYENLMSVDAENNPIPWMTYSSVFYLSQLDISECDVFEWGAGNSTLFFAQRAKTVTTVESNEYWFDYVNKSKPSNVDLNLVEQDLYAEIIHQKNKKYDIISIDGDIFRRFECAYYAFEFLNDGGMIILDNSDWLQNTTALLREKDLIQIDFSGLGPINDYIWCTSIFLTRTFNFKSLNNKQPGFVKGGLNNERD